MSQPAVQTQTRSTSELLRLYLDITRPKVMALVVFTGLPALLLGQEVWPTPMQAFWVLLGTGFAGAASSAFNAYFEREADARMARTRNRPLPAAKAVPQVVFGNGVLLTVLSTLILAVVGGPTAVAVALATIGFYVCIYTLWLKPRTPQNIVIGGAAGSTAPLIASAAVDGSISLGAWILFAIIFLWTPPHFWGLAIYRKREYESAGFPMMPSVVGDAATRRQSLGYTLALLPVTLAPVWLGYLGWLYGAVAVVGGLWFLSLVVRSMAADEPMVDWKVFKGSVSYLSVLFLAMLVDLIAPSLLS